MEKMPFTRYGFSFYDPAKWKTWLDTARLVFVEERLTGEPVIDLVAIGYEGDKIVTDSLCVVAEKRKTEL